MHRASGVHFRGELNRLRAAAISDIGLGILVIQNCRAGLGPIPETALTGFEEPPFDAAAQGRFIALTQHADLGQLNIRHMGGRHLQAEHLGLHRRKIQPPVLARREFKRRHLREDLPVR